MRNILFILIFLCPPFLKKILMKLFCNARFGVMTSIGWFTSVIGKTIKIGDYSVIKPFTLIRCDGDVTLGNYSEISSFSIIYGCSSIRAGNKCYIGPQTWINVSEDLVLGNGVGIGPRTMIFTHGSFLPYTDGYPVRFGKVTIGNNVWIPAGVFIFPGVQIGDNVLVNSRSVIKKSIPADQYVEGFPAKIIRPMEEVRRKITPEIRDELINDILQHFISFLKKTQKRAVFNMYDEDKVELLLYNKEYLITLVKSNGLRKIDILSNKRKTKIILNNYEDFKMATKNKKILVFDFISKTTTYSLDKVHLELYKFLKMYYGIYFEYIK